MSLVAQQPIMDKVVFSPVSKVSTALPSFNLTFNNSRVELRTIGVFEYGHSNAQKGLFYSASKLSNTTSNSNCDDEYELEQQEQEEEDVVECSTTSNSNSDNESFLDAHDDELKQMLYTCNDDDLRMSIYQVYENKAKNTNSKLSKDEIILASKDEKQEEKQEEKTSSNKTSKKLSANVIPAGTTLWSSVCSRILNKPTRTTFQLQSNKHVELNSEFDAYINHSCDSNMKLQYDESNNTITFVSTKNIKAGEQLCLDYENTDQRLAFPFTCDCKTNKCRGLISGKRV